MKFSDKIVFMRKKRGISQDRLAKKMGVSRQTIYKWEADLNTPEFNKIEKLAEILNISYDLLLDDSIDLETYFNENKETSTENNNQSTVPNERGINKKVLFIALGIAFSIIILTAIIVGIVLGNDTNTDTGSSIITDTDTNTDTDTDVIVDNHNWSDWQEIDKGSCDTPQTLERVCSECGEKEAKTGKIVVEHRLSNYWHTKSPATCYEAEKQYTYCYECNFEKYRDGAVALGHTFENEKCIRCTKAQYTEGVIYKVYGSNAYVMGYEGTDSSVSISPYYTPEGETKKYPVIDVQIIGSDVVTELIIPEGVTKIGSTDFNCPNLETIKFPASLKAIFNTTFASCANLKAVYISDIKSWCSVSPTYDNFDGEMIFYLPYNMYLNNELLTDLHITKDIQEINSCVFANCMSIKRLTMEHNDYNRIIHIRAFENCGLEYAQIDSQAIYENAFRYCMNLKSVKLSIDPYFPNDNSFNLCYHLVEVYSTEPLGSYGSGQVTKYAKIIHKDLDAPSVLTETKDGFVFATIDNINYLIQYVGSDPVVKLPRSFNGESYTIATNFSLGGSPNTRINAIYIPKEVLYIENDGLQTKYFSNLLLTLYFEVDAPLKSWTQKLEASEQILFGQKLDY